MINQSMRIFFFFRIFDEIEICVEHRKMVFRNHHLDHHRFGSPEDAKKYYGKRDHKIKQTEKFK